MSGPDIKPNANGAAAALTDGTGVSPITAKKFLKDFVADFLITAAAMLGATSIVGAVNGIPTDVAGGVVIATGILGAAIKAGYRAVLRWATSPD